MVDIKHTHFIQNIAGKGGSVSIAFVSLSSLHYVTLDSCMFKKNVGYLGAVYVGGYASVTCKHSIFDSNGALPCREAIMFKILLNDSMTHIMNTTFVNNFCSTVYAEMGGVSTLRISDSAFVRNKDMDGLGGALAIVLDQYQPNDHPNARITRVLFKENIGTVGSVLSVLDGGVLLTKCTFLNTFAHFQGGLIFSSSGSSTNLSLYHSVFRQTIETSVVNNAKEFMTTSFVRLFSSDTLTIVNTTFDQQTKSDDPQIFVPAANQILIDNASLSSCPLGQNIDRTYYKYKDGNNRLLTGLTFSCKQCDYNSYSLQRGTARGLYVQDGFQCLPCPHGANCAPAIKSKKNYCGYYVSSNPPKMAFTICPFGYCKSPPTNSTDYNACQGKRTGVMCEMCSHGYTETLWSTYCTLVMDCGDYWFWILFLALVFSIASILVFKPPFVTFCSNQILWVKRSSRTTNTYDYHDVTSPFFLGEETRQENMSLSLTEEQKQDKRQFSRFVEIIFYFYQIAQLLISPGSLKELFATQFLEPVLGFFNFQPSFTKRSYLCPFPGLTAETKLVFKIAPVYGTLIAIFLIYGMHSLICRMKGAFHPPFAPYLQASIKTILLGYVTMATVSISLIRCVLVAGETRWFCNGNITCYHWWQYVSFAFIAIFVIPFIFVLALVSFKLQHNKITVEQFLVAIIVPLPFLMLWLLRFARSSVANVEENENLNALKEILLAPYKKPDGANKRGTLYWQSILIARRFILVLIFCIITTPSFRLFCLTLVCTTVFGFHLKVKPFQNTLANNLESLSLFFLIILGLINLFKSVVDSEESMKGSLTTVLKGCQWLEAIVVGLFPAAFLLLLSFAIISFSVRILFVCCR